MSNISGQQQPTQFMPQQQNTMQMPGMGIISGISGMQSNFPGMMIPGGNMPSGEMPSGEMPPAMPDGTQPVDGQEPPAIPDGEELPELPDGETPPEMPSGQTPPEIPSGEMPVSAPSESDSNMPQPPFGQPSFGGSFSGMNSMNSLRAMSFMNR